MKAYDIISIILKEMTRRAVPGVKTIDIDKHAEKMIKNLGARSVNKGYKPEFAQTPWEWVSCINVNNVIAHGKPSDYVLQDGDIVSFDLGIKKGWECADAALSVGVGNIDRRRQRLLYNAKKVVYEAIQWMQPGARTEDIAKIIEYKALENGYLVNRRFAGHRIGREMHMKPNIYNTQEPDHVYAKLEVGQVYCVEPMITNGQDSLGLFIDSDQWTCVTADGKDSAFFEHMVLIEETGPKILTTHFKYEQGGDNSESE
jgi:methionyl aminopeptidase